MEKGSEAILKVIVIGDAAVGKTNLMTRYAGRDFDEQSKPTIGADFIALEKTIEGKKYQVKFWDTAGQEKYRALGSKFYKDANGIMLVYDVTNKRSYEHLNKWVAEVKEKSRDDITVAIIGNKIDLKEERQVSEEEGKRFSVVFRYFFLETSAKTRDNVEEAFDTLLSEAAKKLNKEDGFEEETKEVEKFGVTKLEQKAKGNNKGCCS